MTPTAYRLHLLLGELADEAGGEVRISARQLASRLGCARETAQRALTELCDLGYVQVQGGPGRRPILRPLTCEDALSVVEHRHRVESGDGAEYTPVQDEMVAWRERLRWWARRGRGPAHLVAAGRCLLGQLEESQLDDRACEALHGCAPRVRSGGHAP